MIWSLDLFKIKNAIILVIYVLFNRKIFEWANNVSVQNESFLGVLKSSVLNFAPITLFLKLQKLH